MTGRGRVLVVDDEPVVLDTLRDVLEALGYDASTAATGEQAIAAMVTVQPHVVFLDLGMPGISGLEALAYFRQHHRTVPVIVITGSIEQDIARQARDGGAFDVVGKPQAPGRGGSSAQPPLSPPLQRRVFIELIPRVLKMRSSVAPSGA